MGGSLQRLLGLAVCVLMVIPGYVASRERPDEGPAWTTTSFDDEELERRASSFDEALDRMVAGVDDVDEAAAASVGQVIVSTPNSTGIDDHIREAASRYGVPQELITAMIEAESRFDVHAVSPRGALGLMQLMPGTAASLGIRDPFDPRQNIEGGVRHLCAMMARFRQNLPLALAAYNAGEQAVIRHRGIPPYRETREYVRRILGRLGADHVKALDRDTRGRPEVAIVRARESAPTRIRAWIR